MSPRRAPRRRIRLDNDARRAQLLALARRTFSDRSYDEVSIDDLANAAAISKGLLYHYFPTKRDLYVAAMREIADELIERVAAIPVDLAPVERVTSGLTAYLDFVQLHSRAFVALMRGGVGSDPEVAAVIESVRKRLYDQFLEDSPVAALLRGYPKFEIAVRGWLGFVEATSIDWCANPRLPRDELRELLVAVLFATMQSVAAGVLANPAKLAI